MSPHDQQLPSLDQALAELDSFERRTSIEQRIAETRKALEANERFARDPARVDAYYAHLDRMEMFQPIYGIGNNAEGIPMALPPYIMHILERSSRVLFALMRSHVREHGPQYLVDRMPKGWLSDEMAERLHSYYLTTEPDMAFDVLVFGVHARRGITFDEFKESGDYLHCKLLEAQSVDTYFGWAREYLRAARGAGLRDGCHFALDFGPDGAILDDEALDSQTIAALDHPYADDPGSIAFLEVDPEKQPTYQNLCFMSAAMAGDAEPRPLILDPRDLAIRDGRLHSTKRGAEREIKKLISRLVDADLHAYNRARDAEGRHDVVELFREVYQLPHLWPDLARHLMSFYYVNKNTLTELAMLKELTVAPRTDHVTAEHVAEFRKTPEKLHGYAIKPLYGMSAKGVIVDPTLAELEKALAAEPMLMQELFWATPVQPDITGLDDPDVQAGICAEARLVMHGGSPAVAHNPHRARALFGLSRSHFQSADPRRRIKDDPKGRGWYSNVGAILAVKAELGLAYQNHKGIGMSPIYWVD